MVLIVKQMKVHKTALDLESTLPYTNLEDITVNGVMGKMPAVGKCPQKSDSQRQSRRVAARGWGEGETGRGW